MQTIENGAMFWYNSLNLEGNVLTCLAPILAIKLVFVASPHAALRRKSKDWLAWNQDNVSEWGDMSIRGLLSQWASTKQIH
jgi:hypothetical protein